MTDPTPAATDPVPPAASPPAPAAQTTKPPVRESATLRRIARFGEILASLRTIVTSVAVFAALAAVIGLGVREAMRDAIVIDPIELPKDLVDLGYSPQVFTSRIEDERQVIEARAKTSLRRRQLVTAWTQANFDIPGAGLSVKAAIGFARQVLGFSETHIGGDSTHDGQDLVLVLRIGGGNPGAPVRVRAANVNDLIRFGAQEIVKMVEPYVLAAYFYEQETEAGEYTTTLELIAYCLEHRPSTDDRRAYDLWGEVLDKKGDSDGAIAKYQKALALEPKDAFAQNEWGRILAGRGQPAEALEHYARALEITPDDGSILASNMCDALNSATRYDEALVKCLKAISADATYAPGHHNLGLTYENLKRYDDAIAEYKKARTLAPKLAEPCQGWSNVLRAQNKDAKTDAAYQSLCGT